MTIKNLSKKIQILLLVLIAFGIFIGIFFINSADLQADSSYFAQFPPSERTFTASGQTFTAKVWTIQTGETEVTMYWTISGPTSWINKMWVNYFTLTDYSEPYYFYGFYIPGNAYGTYLKSTEVVVPISGSGSYVFKNIPKGPGPLINDFYCKLDYNFKQTTSTYPIYYWLRETGSYQYMIQKPEIYDPYLVSGTQNSLTIEAACVDESSNGQYYFIVNGTWYPAVRISGNETDKISATVTGLSPGTTYSVQAYASNAFGSAYSTKQDMATIRSLSSNTSMQKIETSAGTATAASDGTTYNITVPFETSSITVYPYASDSAKAFVNAGYSSWNYSGSAFGPYFLQMGTNTIPAKVMAEDNTKKEYTLNVIRSNPMPPVVAVTTSTGTQLCSSVSAYRSFTLAGTVRGYGLSVDITASINGKSKSIRVATPQSGTANWSLYWDIYDDVIGQGSYTSIPVSVSNGYPNGSSTATWDGTLAVDKAAPSVPLFSVNPSGWGNSSATVAITPGTDSGGAGVLKTEYSTDGSTWSTYSSLFTVGTEGITTVYARTTDKVGNISGTGSTKVYIDKTAPYAPYIVTNQTWSKENVSVAISGSDGFSGSGIQKSQYSMDGGTSWTDYSSSLTVSTPGTTTITARSIDNAGNYSGTEKVIVRIDKSSPTIESVTGNPSEWVFAPVTLVVNASDTGGSGLDVYSFDNGANWQATNSKSYFSNQGGIIIKVKDIAGNISGAYETINITNIDLNYPTYTGITGNPSSWQSTDVTLTINNAADAGSGLASLPYSFDGGVTWQESNQKTFSSNSEPAIWIRDAVGRTTKTGTIIISKIDKKAPQDFTVSPSTSSATNGDVVLTISNAADFESGLASLPYSFDNGTTWQSQNTKSYSENTSSIIIKVRDVLGNVKEKSVSITNIDKTAPALASGTGQRTGARSASVSFSTNEAGRGYYMVVADGSSAPSSQQVVDNNRELNDNCSPGSISFNVTSGIDNDANAYDIYIVVKDSANNLSSPLKADVPAYSTGTDNGIMKYIMPLGSGAFNIQGMVNGSWVNVSSGEIRLWQKVNVETTDWDNWDWVSDPPVILAPNETELTSYTNGAEKVNDGLGVKVNLSFVDEGKYVKVEYTLRNTTSAALTGVGIANAFRLPRIDGTNLTVKKLSDERGFYAPTSVDNAQINFIVRNSTDVIDVDKYWVGAGWGNPAVSYKWNQFEGFETISNSGMPPVVGAAYSWQDMTLAAGETRTLSVLIGMIQKNYTTALSINDIGEVDCGQIFKVSGSLTDSVTNAKGYNLYYSIDGGSQNLFKHFDTAPGSFSDLDLIIPEGLSGEHSIKFSLINSSDGVEEVSANVVTKSFTIKTYAVSFNLNGGSGQPDTQNIQLNQLATEPTGPARTYYTFDGWYKEAVLVNMWDFAADKVTQATALYAKWTPKTCVITFNSGGGSEFTDKTVTADSAVGELPVSARDGYVFGGWWTAVNGGGTRYNAETIYNVDGNLTLYAKWTANIYAIAFDSQGGSSIEDKNVSYNTAIGALSDTSRTGYTFGGWYSLPNGEGEQYTSATVYPVVGGTTLYAKWTINSYTVTFVGKNSGGVDGNTLKTQTVIHGGAAGAPDVPAATGFAFTGWDQGYDNITGNITVTAQYASLPTYTITAFAGSNGSISSSPSVIYEDDSVTYTITPAVNYHITEVYIDDSSYGEISSYTFTEIEANHTISAFFEIDSYTVSFLDWDGSTVSTGIVGYGETVTPPVHPLRANFDSNGWLPADFTDITQDTVYTAQYTAIPTYTITASAGTNGSISSAGTTTLMRGQGKIYSITPSNGYKIASVKVDGQNQPASGDPVTSYTFSDISSNHAIAALFTPLTYTVTFLDFDSSVLKEQTVDHGGSATAPVAAREGHTFLNWDKSYENVTANISVTAKYKINQYTISFNSQGGSGITPQTGDWGSQINAPSQPQKQAYIFDGWFKDSGCSTGQEWKFTGTGVGSMAIPPDTISGDQTLYAKWATNKYRVEFIDYNGSAILVNGETYQEISEGSGAQAPDTPSDKIIDGQTKTFKRWSVSFNSISSNTTVKALYMDVVRTITFDWNYEGAPSSVSVEVDDGSTANAPVSYDRTGYTFGGWFQNADGSGDEFDTEKLFTQDEAYYAKWVKNKYSVKFIDYAGRTLKNELVEYGNDATAPEVPAREGYSFTGWDKSITDIKASFTVKALYEALPLYTILASTDSMCSIAPSGSTSAYQGSSKTFTVSPSTGFSIIKVLVDGAEQVSGSNPVMSYTFSNIGANHVISAASQIKKYTVKFMDHEGDTIAEYTVSHGDSLIAPQGPARTGYSFTGWDKSTDNIGQNLEINPKYSAKNYNIFFEANGANPISSISAAYDSVISAPAEPERTGYTFGGWHKEAALTNQWDFNTDKVPAQNITLYAKWTINKYTVTFTDYDNSIIQVNGNDTQEVSYGSPATKPDDPASKVIGGQLREFEGWSTAFSSVTDNLTIKALYIGKKYTITFNPGNGEDPVNVVADDGTTAQAPASPLMTGYTFGGWYTGQNGAGSFFDPDDTVSEAAVYYAKWTLKTFTVTFNLSGGSSADGGSLSQTIGYGSSAQAPSDPLKTGYRFTGWDKSFSGITGSITVNAQYSLIPVYTISVEAGTGGEITGDPDVLEGESSVFTIEADSGYKTKEVLTDGIPRKNIEGEPIGTYTFEDVSKNSSISATFEPDSFTVSFDPQNNESISSGSHLYGSLIDNPSAPLRTGYTFGGWYEEESCVNKWDFDSDTVPAADQVLYAKWTANTYMVVFEACGGSGDTRTQTKLFDSAYGKGSDGTTSEPLPVLTKEGSMFKGWYTGENGTGTLIGNDTEVDKAYRITLYAKWSENKLAFPTITAVKADLSAYAWGTWANTPEIRITAVSQDNGTGIKKYQYQAGSDATWHDMSGDDLNTLAISSSTNDLYRFRAISDADTEGEETGPYSLKLDITKPVIDSMQIKNVNGGPWKQILNVLTFHNFFNNSVEVKTGFADTHSGPGRLVYKFVPAGSDAGNIDYTTCQLSSSDISAGFKVLQKEPSFKGQFYAYIIDAVGNQSDVVSGTFINDKNAPALQFAATTDGFSSGKWQKQVETAFLAQDTESGLDRIEIYEAGQLKQTWTFQDFKKDSRGLYTVAFENSYIFSADGSYTVSIKVYDKSGNVSEKELAVKIAKFNIKYDKNSATGGKVPGDSNIYSKEEKAHILGNTGNLERMGYTFTGWNTRADGTGTSYQQGDIIVMTGNLKLYADWNINLYKVNFNTNGGSSIADQIVAFKGKINILEEPKKQGYSFTEWYKDSSLSMEFDPAKDTITSDTTLYAKWMITSDVVNEAAIMLSVENAFKFSGKDSWECVTGDFFMLDTGIMDTKITWESSDPDTVAVQEGNGSVKGIITKSRDKDEKVVMTAKITKDGLSLTKSFLLIIKKKDTTVNELRELSSREAIIKAGENTTVDKIYRSVIDGKTTIDAIDVSMQKIMELLNEDNKLNIVSITIDYYEPDPADEYAFELSGEIVSALAGSGNGIELNTEQGTVRLESGVLKKIEESGTNLYFRMAYGSENEAMESSEKFMNDKTMLKIIGSQGREVICPPVIIDTNISGYPVKVLIPFKGVDEESLSSSEFLNSLFIYVEHDNGSTELIKGSIIIKDNKPYGIEFEISQFSSFQIVSAPESAGADQKSGSKTSHITLVILLISGGTVIAATAAALLLVFFRRKKKKKISI